MSILQFATVDIGGISDPHGIHIYGCTFLLAEELVLICIITIFMGVISLRLQHSAFPVIGRHESGNARRRLPFLKVLTGSLVQELQLQGRVYEGLGRVPQPLMEDKIPRLSKRMPHPIMTRVVTIVTSTRRGHISSSINLAPSAAPS